jgi:NhaP-type Na+/H+ or K+/H+ antiporter
LLRAKRKHKPDDDRFVRIVKKLKKLIKRFGSVKKPGTIRGEEAQSLQLSSPVSSVLVLFVQQMGVGAICGLLLGLGAILLISRLKLDVEGLYPVLAIALVLLTYGLTASLGGSGFLAVYLVGLLLGNSSVQRVDRLSHFHDGLAWLMQIGMFLVLGLLVFPSRLPAIAVSGLLILCGPCFGAVAGYVCSSCRKVVGSGHSFIERS